MKKTAYLKKYIDYRKPICDDFMTNASQKCDRFIDEIETFVSSNTDKFEHILSTDTYNNLFGSISYEFSMKPCNYPEFVELPSITNEEFKSQMSGILGLYLGLSGMSEFAMILSIIGSMKSRWEKEQKTVEKTPAIFKVWRFLGMESLLKKDFDVQQTTITHF